MGTKISRQALVLAAVALGKLKDAGEASKYSDDEIRAMIGNDKTYLSGTSKGEPNPLAKAGGQGQDQPGAIKPSLGHFVIVKEPIRDLNGDVIPPGLYEVMGADEGGIVYLSNAAGDMTAEVGMAMFESASQVESTGIKKGDLIQSNYGETKDAIGVVRGITRSNTLGVNFVEVDHHAPRVGVQKYSNDNGRASIQEPPRTLGPSTQVELDEIKDHWGTEGEYELTEEGAAFLSKLFATVKGIEDSTVDPNDMQFRLQLTSDRENHTKSMKKGDNLYITLAYERGTDNMSRFVSQVQFAQSESLLYQRNGPVGCTAQPVSMERMNEAFREAVTTHPHPSAGSFLTSLPLAAFEYQPPRFDCQPDEQQDFSHRPGDPSSPEPKEGLMENSRRTLADIKGTPDNPKKASVSSQKIQSLVDESITNSESLAALVRTILEERKQEMKALLGVDEDMKKLGEQVLDDIESAFLSYAKDLDEWKVAVEQKIVSKVEFTIPDMPDVEVKDPHMTLNDVLFNAVLRLPTVMVGPSGAGKTRAAMEIAKILGLEFSFAPLGPTQTESKFSGYPDARGFYIPTEFYLRFKYGGVMLLDELDAGNANVLIWLNAAIQNKVAAFPHGFITQLEADGHEQEAESLNAAGGMVNMHPDTVILAAANTFGKGADMIYQGRNPLDGATLKRFKFVFWDYDEVLERKLAGDDLWVTFVQTVRSAVNELEMHHIVSPVDSIDGARMLAAGQDWQKVAMQTVFAGLKDPDVRKIIKEPQNREALSDLYSKLTKRQEDAKKKEAVSEGA